MRVYNGNLQGIFVGVKFVSLDLPFSLSFKRSNICNRRAVIVKFFVIYAVYLCLLFMLIKVSFRYSLFLCVWRATFKKKVSQDSTLLYFHRFHFISNYGPCILVQLTFYSLQYHDNKKMMVQSEICMYLAAFLVLSADGWRERRGSAPERKRELSQK